MYTYTYIHADVGCSLRDVPYASELEELIHSVGTTVCPTSEILRFVLNNCMNHSCRYLPSSVNCIRLVALIII